MTSLNKCFGFEISRETEKKKKRKQESASLVSNRCHDKTNSHQPRSAPQSLALTKQQQLLIIIIWLIKLNAFFCFSLNKRSPEESQVFLQRYFWGTKRKSTETITERCFSCQNKSVCQKLARSCKKWKLAKNAIYALSARSPSIDGSLPIRLATICQQCRTS